LLELIELAVDGSDMTAMEQSDKRLQKQAYTSTLLLHK